MRFVAKAYEKGAVRYVPGNHCNKLYRYLKGNPVKVMHGLETTAAELKELSPPTERKSPDNLSAYMSQRRFMTFYIMAISSSLTPA